MLMATTKQLYNEFKAFMDKVGIRYREFDRDDNIIYLSFGGEHATYVLVDFDEVEGDGAGAVHFVSQGFAKCMKKDLAAALIAVNQLNARFRWVKFFINEDGEISCSEDALVDIGSVGNECANIAFNMSEIIGKALEVLADIAIPNEEAGRVLAMIAAMKSANQS